MLSRLAWEGLITVTVTERGRVTREDTFHNLITDAGLSALAGTLGGIDLAGGITWIAVGDGTTPPAPGDTKLANETFRKFHTSHTLTGPAMRTHLYLAPADAVGQISEIGWFTGPSASATKDSGVMLARVLYSHTKTALEAVTIQRTDTLARA